MQAIRALVTNALVLHPDCVMLLLFVASGIEIIYISHIVIVMARVRLSRDRSERFLLQVTFVNHAGAMGILDVFTPSSHFIADLMHHCLVPVNIFAHELE